MTHSTHASTAQELQALIQAERAGTPFLLFRGQDEEQVIQALAVDQTLRTIGRHPSCDIALPWDDRVSRTHAVLELLGDTWTLSDDGLSRNGTFLNGDRLVARHRLTDRDVIRMGQTTLTYRHPQGVSAVTAFDGSNAEIELTPMQRKVLIALCRPYRDGSPYAAPASNADIGNELYLSLDGVKTHMRGLFERFAVGDLPQNQKRARVVEMALQAGIITSRDL